VKTLKIAIQKSGRLNEKSVELLKNCGLDFDNYKSSLISSVANFPLEILFLRDDEPDIVLFGHCRFPPRPAPLLARRGRPAIRR